MTPLAQVDFASQQAAADKRVQQAAAMQQQDAVERRQQEAAALQQLQSQRQQQQEAAARLQHHLQQQQQQQQRDALAYLSAAQLQQPQPRASQQLHGGVGMSGGAWPDGMHPTVLQLQQQQQQAQGFGPAASLSMAHSPPDMLRQLAAAQQGGWGTAGGVTGGSGHPSVGSMLPTGMQFGADQQLASSLQWYELQRQQRQQEAERQQQVNADDFLPAVCNHEPVQPAH